VVANLVDRGSAPDFFGVFAISAQETDFEVDVGTLEFSGLLMRIGT
jgi:hypothetical protein